MDVSYPNTLPPSLHNVLSISFTAFVMVWVGVLLYRFGRLKDAAEIAKTPQKCIFIPKVGYYLESIRSMHPVHRLSVLSRSAGKRFAPVDVLEIPFFATFPNQRIRIPLLSSEGNDEEGGDNRQESEREAGPSQDDATRGDAGRDGDALVANSIHSSGIEEGDEPMESNKNANEQHTSETIQAPDVGQQFDPVGAGSQTYEDWVPFTEQGGLVHANATASAATSSAHQEPSGTPLTLEAPIPVPSETTHDAITIDIQFHLFKPAYIHLSVGIPLEDVEALLDGGALGLSHSLRSSLARQGPLAANNMRSAGQNTSPESIFADRRCLFSKTMGFWRGPEEGHQRRTVNEKIHIPANIVSACIEQTSTIDAGDSGFYPSRALFAVSLIQCSTPQQNSFSPIHAFLLLGTIVYATTGQGMQPQEVVISSYVVLPHKCISFVELFVEAGNDANGECIVCMSEPISILLLPCRHSCVCPNCLEHLTQCPVCRAPIDSYIIEK